jgi:hypothetical protein
MSTTSDVRDLIDNFGDVDVGNTEASATIQQRPPRAFIKALAAAKLTTNDGVPAVVYTDPDTAGRLLLGSVGSAYNRPALIAAGTTHVLCVAAGLQLRFPESFIYKRVDIADRPDAAADFEAGLADSLDFIDACITAGGAVLVHCFAGKSRSTSMCVAWLMRSRGLTFLESIDLCREVRPVVQPNLGFVSSLLKLERKCRSERQKRGGDPPQEDGKEI